MSTAGKRRPAGKGPDACEKRMRALWERWQSGSGEEARKAHDALLDATLHHAYRCHEGRDAWRYLSLEEWQSEVALFLLEKDVLGSWRAEGSLCGFLGRALDRRLLDIIRKAERDALARLASTAGEADESVEESLERRDARQRDAASERTVEADVIGAEAIDRALAVVAEGLARLSTRDRQLLILFDLLLLGEPWVSTLVDPADLAGLAAAAGPPWTAAEIVVGLQRAWREGPYGRRTEVVVEILEGRAIDRTSREGERAFRTARNRHQQALKRARGRLVAGITGAGHADLATYLEAELFGRPTPGRPSGGEERDD